MKNKYKKCLEILKYLEENINKKIKSRTKG